MNSTDRTNLKNKLVKYLLYIAFYSKEEINLNLYQNGLRLRVSVTNLV
jgi:hypothetical protein